MQDFEVGTDSVDILDFLQLLLVKRNLLKIGKMAVIMFGSAYEELIRDSYHFKMFKIFLDIDCEIYASFKLFNQ